MAMRLYEIRLWLPRFWQVRTIGNWLVSPLSLGFRIVASLRRWAYRTGLRSVESFKQPVVVVGNLTVGGSGKTPLVIYLARLLKEQGYRPGIVSRGYGGRASKLNTPLTVDVDTPLEDCGDEARLLRQRSDVPVVVGRARPEGVRTLIDEQQCDVVISDDGLQHYRMGREVEIAVIGSGGFGNGFCLPAGPMREPASRLQNVDLVVCNGYDGTPCNYMMEVKYDTWVNLASGRRSAVSEFVHESLHAVAGVGQPEPFFDYLRRSGCRFQRHVFPDHHRYRAEELEGFAGQIVVMTEKDAVKWAGRATENLWYVPITASLPASFNQEILNRLSK